MRWLALAIDKSGLIKAAIVNDTTNCSLPHGDHTKIINVLPGCDELSTVIELPDGNFRPEVFDCNEDQEAPVVFLDL